MARPLQCKAIASARLKNDKAGAATLAQLLRADLLPEARVRPAAGAPAAGHAAAPGAAGPPADPAAQPGPRGPGRSRPRPACGLLERPRPPVARLVPFERPGRPAILARLEAEGRLRPAKNPGYVPQRLHPVTITDPNPLAKAAADAGISVLAPRDT